MVIVERQLAHRSSKHQRPLAAGIATRIQPQARPWALRSSESQPARSAASLVTLVAKWSAYSNASHHPLSHWFFCRLARITNSGPEDIIFALLRCLRARSTLTPHFRFLLQCAYPLAAYCPINVCFDTLLQSSLSFASSPSCPGSFPVHGTHLRPYPITGSVVVASPFVTSTFLSFTN